MMKEVYLSLYTDTPPNAANEVVCRASAAWCSR
jgi:hypothetical protein